MAKSSNKPPSKSEISKIVKEIKVKFKDYFDSGYLYMLERNKYDEALTNNFHTNDLRLAKWRAHACFVIFEMNPTATYVVHLGLRTNEISIKNKDSITSFLRRKGFKYTLPGMAYRI